LHPARQWAPHAACSKEGDDKATAREAIEDDDEVEGAEESYFAVDLFVAALGDGKLAFEGATRKKRDILEQVASSAANAPIFTRRRRERAQHVTT